MIVEFEYQINVIIGPNFDKVEYLKIFDEAEGLEEYKIEPEVPGEITVSFISSDSIFLEIQDKLFAMDENFAILDFVTELELENEDSSLE